MTEKRITVDDIFNFKVDFGDLFKDIPTIGRDRTANAPKAPLVGPALTPAADVVEHQAASSQAALEAARAEGRAEMMGRVQAWAEGDGARAYGEVTAHFLRAAVAKMLADLGSGDG